MFEYDTNAESKDSSLLRRLRLATFLIFHKLMKNYFDNQLAHILLQLVETVLMLAYPLSLNGTFGELSLYATYLSLRYRSDYDADVYVFVISVSVSLVYILSFLIWIMNLCLFSADLSSPKENFRYCSRFYGFALIVLQYVLELPLIEMLLMLFTGNYPGSSGAQSGAEVFFSIAAGIILLLLLGLVIISTLFFHEEQIKSDLPWTMSPLALDYLKLLKKCVIACAVAWDPTGAVRDYILIALLLISSAQLYTFTRSFQMDKRWIQNATVLAEVVSWLVYVICIFNDLVEPGAIDYMFLIIFLVPALVTFTISIRWRRHVWLLSRTWGELKEPLIMEEYVRNLLLLVDSKEKLSDYPTLMGLAKQHSLACQNKDCVCHLLDTKADLTGTNLSENHNTIEDLPIDAKVGNIIYNLARTFVQEAANGLGRQAKLFVLNAYINFILLNNKFQALYDLQQAAELVPSIYEEFLIYRLQYVSPSESI